MAWSGEWLVPNAFGGVESSNASTLGWNCIRWIHSTLRPNAFGGWGQQCLRIRLKPHMPNALGRIGSGKCSSCFGPSLIPDAFGYNVERIWHTCGWLLCIQCGSRRGGLIHARSLYCAKYWVRRYTAWHEAPSSPSRITYFPWIRSRWCVHRPRCIPSGHSNSTAISYMCM